MQNRLLAAMRSNDLEQLRTHLKLVSLPLGKVLYEERNPPRYVYFPTTSIVSKLCRAANGASAEVAVVGNDGVIGIATIMGGKSVAPMAVVQSAGYAYQMTAERFRQEFERGTPFQIPILRYAQALITQMAQTAACNRHHSLDQQLCRWLLLSLDCLSSNEIAMTQELIATHHGVRRESVAVAAGKLQRAGLIQYGRGHISVLDRTALEARACECYAVVKKEYERLVPRRMGADLESGVVDK
jgi:CRP-like cAMP-binding protein